MPHPLVGVVWGIRLIVAFGYGSGLGPGPTFKSFVRDRLLMRCQTRGAFSDAKPLHPFAQSRLPLQPQVHLCNSPPVESIQIRSVLRTGSVLSAMVAWQPKHVFAW